MNTTDLQLRFLDATEQAKGILDLIEAAGGSGEDAGLVLADGSLWRAAQCARERVERAERCYHKLERAYNKATK